MPALPPKADIRGYGRNVRYVPIADIGVVGSRDNKAPAWRPGLRFRFRSACRAITREWLWLADDSAADLTSRNHSERGAAEMASQSMRENLIHRADGPCPRPWH